jgi:hypothetical protein
MAGAGSFSRSRRTLRSGSPISATAITPSHSFTRVANLFWLGWLKIEAEIASADK